MACKPLLPATFILATLAAAVVSAAAEMPVAVPVTGEPFPATLSAVSPQGQCTFVTDGAPRTIAAADLVRWGSCLEPGRGPYVLFADGGLLVADILSANKERLVVDSTLFGELKLPLERIAGVVFQTPTDRMRRDLLIARLSAASGLSDRLVLTNDDELSGAVRSIGEGKIRMDTTLGPVDVETLRTRALGYNPTLRRIDRPQGQQAYAGFSDGSVLISDSVIIEGKTLRITVAGGENWTGSAADLVCLQPLGGRAAVYLSDLKPASYRHVPYLELAWPYQLDRSVVGTRLRADGKTYVKGLGMHSAARLTYLLVEPYSRFSAEIAVDDTAGGRGSVRFRVFVDERQRYASPVVRGGQPPLPISIDIAGAKRLDLVVDFADRADELDHADWLDARLIR